MIRCQDTFVTLVANRLIYRGAPGTATANCCFPAIARLAEGTLLATWRVGSQKDSPDGAIWISRSDDDGDSWSRPNLIIGSGMRKGRNGEPHYGPLTVLTDGRLLCAAMWIDRSEPEWPFFNPTTEGLLPQVTVFLESADNGRTWRVADELDEAPYHSPMPITGPVLALPDGTLACPFEVNKCYDDPSPWRHAAAWKISRDGGASWPECVELANDPSGQLMYWDAHAVVASADRYVAAFWTFDRGRNRDRTIHLAESADRGRTWTVPHDSGIVGQVAEPVPLGDDRLLLVYVDRFVTRSIRARLSYDLGRTFDVNELVIHQQPVGVVDAGHNSVTADYLQDMNQWAFGRVHAVADAGGTVWVVYYAGDSATTGIYCARLQIK